MNSYKTLYEKKTEKVALTKEEMLKMISGTHEMKAETSILNKGIERLIGKIKAGTVKEINLFEDKKNDKTLNICFYTSYLGQKINITLALKSRDGIMQYKLRHIEQESERLSEAELIEIIDSPNKVKIDNLEERLKIITRGIFTSSALGLGYCTDAEHVISKSGLEKNTTNIFIAKTIIDRLEATGYGLNDKKRLAEESINDLVINDTPKGFEIFLDSMKETRKAMDSNISNRILYDKEKEKTLSKEKLFEIISKIYDYDAVLLMLDIDLRKIIDSIDPKCVGEIKFFDIERSLLVVQVRNPRNSEIDFLSIRSDKNGGLIIKGFDDETIKAMKESISKKTQTKKI